MKRLLSYYCFVCLFLLSQTYTQEHKVVSLKSCPPCEFSEPPAHFCNLLIDEDACIQNNAIVQGDLTVCGTINGSGNDFVFAYSTVTQTATQAPTFSDISFSNNGIINDGWSHTPGSSDFICNQTGKYLIEYDAILRISNSQLTDASIIALQNGAEIPGSQGSIQQPTNNKPLALTRSFIVDFTAGQILKLQFTGGTAFVELLANSGNSSITTPPNGIRPSITLTITRVL